MATRQKGQRGMLIVFEGPDGSGKTTQRKLFKQWLRGEGYETVTTKWNSSKVIKPLIRARKAAHSLSPEEFCLLHACDFQHRLETVIMPALAEGKVVIADRYIYTAFARDVARGLSREWLKRIYAPIHRPDLVYYFSVSPETSLDRVAAERTPNYYEAGQDITEIEAPLKSYLEFMKRVIEEYRSLGRAYRFVTVDGERPVYKQHRFIRNVFLQAEARAGRRAKQSVPWIPAVEVEDVA